MKYHDAWQELKLWVVETGFSILDIDTSPLAKIEASQYRKMLEKINELEEKHE